MFRLRQHRSQQSLHGGKRKVVIDVARPPGKAKIAEETGEKRKVESDVEDLVLQGSPMKAKLQEDEQMADRLNTISTISGQSKNTRFEVAQRFKAHRRSREAQHSYDGSWGLEN